MSKFIHNEPENLYSLISDGHNIVDLIPKGCYIISRQNKPPFNFFIKRRDNVVATDLHNSNSLVNRIINSFNSSTTNLGVLLHGLKGMGKTKTILQIIERLQDKMPIIFIEESISLDSEFIEFINLLGSRIVLVFDEFDHYFTTKDDSDTNQQKLLPILDGVASKANQTILTLLTVNDLNRVHDSFLGRPGRVRYTVEYNKIILSELIEYLKSHGYDDALINNIKTTWIKTNKFTWDILMTILNELKLYPQLSYNEVVSVINIEHLMQFKVVASDKMIVTSVDSSGYDKDLNFAHYVGTIINNPLSTGETVVLNMSSFDNEDTFNFDLRPKTLVAYDNTTGIYRFNDSGFIIETKDYILPRNVIMPV